jgi:hypothetical protein
MPYIDKQRRKNLTPAQVRNAGELNYLITKVIRDYISDESGIRGLSYQVINDIIGALEGAKLEFYRRIAAPYEDTKIKLNGDVY